MRRWLGFAVLAVASCAAPEQPVQPITTAAPAPGTEIFLDQGWSAADREVFTTTAQGSELLPYAWFAALRRTDRDEPFAADQLARYGYLPGAASARNPARLPVGFVLDGASGDPKLGITCAACHTGQLHYKGQVWRIDGGRANADFQAFLTDLGAAARATVAKPDRFTAFAAAVLGPRATAGQSARLHGELAAWSAAYTGFMDASLPDQPWGPGRLDAFGMIFNRVAGLDLAYPGNYHKADAPVRYPFIWDAPRQDRTQWTGAAPNGTYLRGLARNTGEVFGVFGRFEPRPLPVRQIRYLNSVNFAGLQTLEEKVAALKPPPWPRAVLGLDQARADRGAQVFTNACASCHGIQPSATVLNAWRTPVLDVGTDRRTFDNSLLPGSPRVLTGTQQPPVIGERLAEPSPKVSILANAVVGSLVRAAALRDSGVRAAIRRDLDERRLPLLLRAPSAAPEAAVASVEAATTDLYKADPAPGAAYEARVLTGVWAVGPYLHNGSVPNLWELLKPARERMTRFAVGHREFDPVHVGLVTTLTAGPAVFVADPASGNGNGGHEYGTMLPEADRWALIEYLETL